MTNPPTGFGDVWKWTDGRTMDNRSLLYYKLSLWSSGSAKLKAWIMYTCKTPCQMGTEMQKTGVTIGFLVLRKGWRNFGLTAQALTRHFSICTSRNCHDLRCRYTVESLWWKGVKAYLYWGSILLTVCFVGHGSSQNFWRLGTCWTNRVKTCWVFDKK